MTSARRGGEVAVVVPDAEIARLGWGGCMQTWSGFDTF